MSSNSPDSDPENEPTTLLWAKLRLRVERAAIPTLGELEGVKLVVETTSGGRLLKLVVLALLALSAYVWLHGVPF